MLFYNSKNVITPIYTQWKNEIIYITFFKNINKICKYTLVFMQFLKIPIKE